MPKRETTTLRFLTSMKPMRPIEWQDIDLLQGR